MDAGLLTPSKYIKAVEMKGKDVTVTITDVRIEELEKTDRSKEQKGIISFRETKKAWVINVTNAKCLIAMFGRETDAWLGKKVTLFPERNEMSESGVAIRVRGSPDIARDITFTLKLAKKKDRQVTLKATGRNGNGASNGNGHGKAAPQTASAPPPADDRDAPPDGREPEPPDDLPSEPPLFADEEPGAAPAA